MMLQVKAKYVDLVQIKGDSSPLTPFLESPKFENVDEVLPTELETKQICKNQKPKFRPQEVTEKLSAWNIYMQKRFEKDSTKIQMKEIDQASSYYIRSKLY